MKISEIRFHVVAPMGEAPIAQGSTLGWAFVEVLTDEGVVGTGECSNWLRDTHRILGPAVSVIAESLIGMDASNIEAIWQKVFRNYTYLGSRGLITTVLSGIDIALWDIKGQVLGQPIYDLLGGSLRDSLSLYAHPGPVELIADGLDDIPALVADSCLELVAEGYDALKFDPFIETWPTHTEWLGGNISRRGIHIAIDIVAAMREAVGPDVALMVDAHGSFNVASAVECIRALEPFDLTWFEEPIPPEGIDGLRQVRDRVNVPICVGERLYTRWDVLPYLTGGLADFLMPDVCWTGGITELKRISTLADTFHVPMAPHDALGPIQILAGAHTMKTVPNFYKLEFHHLWVEQHNACLDEPLDIRQGQIHLSNRPGLGHRLDHDYLDTHRALGWSVA